eukprot:c23815_g1_i1 orf=181-1617(+)
MSETPAAANASCVVLIKRELVNLQVSESGDDDESLHPRPFISRVSAPLHVVHPSAFTPQTLVIGPFHRKLIKESVYAFSFAEMEEYKLMAARAFSAEITSSKGAPSLIVAVAEEIAREEKKVRACFGREMGLERVGNEEMGYMLALDCVFVVAFMLSLYNELYTGNAEDKRTRKWVPSSFSRVYEEHFSYPVKKAVTLDLLLLENQVPLFLVKKVMQMMDGRYGDDVEASFQELVAVLAYRALPFCKKVKLVEARNAKHLLDCLYTQVTADDDDQNFVKEGRTERFPPLQRNRLRQGEADFLPTASKLSQAGVQFKGHCFSLRRVSFEHHTLTLPIIHVNDETELIFRNLLAHESQLVGRAEVASYLHFMNSLINTAADVEVLVEAGVITENVGDYKHVARLWNELATNTVCIFTPRYNNVANSAKDYVNKEIHSVLAELRERYFSRPWLVLSLLSGTALLIMTFITMWYTIEVYIKA